MQTVGGVLSSFAVGLCLLLYNAPLGGIPTNKMPYVHATHFPVYTGMQ